MAETCVSKNICCALSGMINHKAVTVNSWDVTLLTYSFTKHLTALKTDCGVLLKCG